MMRVSCWFAVVALGTFALASDGSADTKDKYQLSAEEQKLLDLTNQERKQQNVSLLRPDSILFKVARGHSANMARQGKMAHVLDDKTPYQRIKEAGYRYRYAGENVANGDADMEDIMKAWMASPKHRDNILKPEFTEVGLGLARTPKGVVYYTQVFATPRSKD